jgi:XTP/dITP diphosphohydrolase
VAPRGTNGFGFDAVFLPEGSAKTYGEMSPDEKGAVSHRGKALKALIAALSL